MRTIFEDNRELLNPEGETLYKEAAEFLSELFEKWEDVPSRETEAVIHSLVSELANQARGDVFYNQDQLVKLEREKKLQQKADELKKKSCAANCSSCGCETKEDRKYPWDDDVVCGGEEWEKLWETVSPSDFYFDARRYDNGTECNVVVLVPIDYWNKNNYWYDQGVEVEIFCKDWPSYLDNIMECTWEIPVEVSIDEVVSKLESLGFVRNVEVCAGGTDDEAADGEEPVETEKKIEPTPEPEAPFRYSTLIDSDEYAKMQSLLGRDKQPEKKKEVPKITEFTKEYAFLANDFECTQNSEYFYQGDGGVFSKRYDFSTSEHVYQMRKTLDPEAQALIKAAPDARTAISIGKKAPEIKNFEAQRLNVMESILLDKFLNLEFKIKLLQTGDAELINGASKDKYWGVDRNGNGENQLGKLLMRIRDMIKRDEGTVTELVTAKLRKHELGFVVPWVTFPEC